MIIVGAGLSGLIAAHMFPNAQVIEAAPRPTETHKALLRFRSDVVSRVTGIDFRQVEVRKGIWSCGQYREPSIELANHYSRKVMGKLLPRSIWNLDAVTRYIAPEDFYQQLINQVGERIDFGLPWRPDPVVTHRGPVITTAPLPVTLQAFGIKHELEFKRSEIWVERFRIPECDVHQTVYFPDPGTPLYRASITGDLLIAEFSGPEDELELWKDLVMEAFALPSDEQWRSLGKVSQSYGKVAPINDYARKALIAKLSAERNVFSLGRFATWRNILLDDVVQDAMVIKRLIKASAYERSLAAL